MVSARPYPTRRGWLVLGLTVPLSVVLGAIWGGEAVIALDLALLALFGVSYLLSVPISALRMSRLCADALSVAVDNVVHLRLGADRPVRGWLRDEPPPDWERAGNDFEIELGPDREWEGHYTVRPPDRGSFEFGATFLRLECPLGLLYRQIEVANPEPVRVIPNILALRDFDLLNQQGRLAEIGMRKTRRRGQGTEFESLREYVSGDAYRTIDWKASARRGRFVVRQYELERNQCVMLLIDGGRHQLAEADGRRKIDAILDGALMLAHAAATRDDLVGVLLYDADIRVFVPPKRGRSQVGVILDAIHDARAVALESDPTLALSTFSARWKRRSLLVVFTSLGDADSAHRIVAAIGPRARTHLVLIVDVADPKIRQAAQTVPVLSERYPDRDLAPMAAAQWILEERREARGIVKAAGLNVLESDPAELPADLVRFYFDAKAAGRL